MSYHVPVSLKRWRHSDKQRYKEFTNKKSGDNDGDSQNPEGRNPERILIVRDFGIQDMNRPGIRLFMISSFGILSFRISTILHCHHSLLQLLDTLTFNILTIRASLVLPSAKGIIKDENQSDKGHNEVLQVKG
ncbi:hypothetical protein M514_08945 [Trichuris suis]|uniref:Uncharacterized protein n=1 Tax=Trichuris suis TaxID=68888 RepID=A0A085NLQ7_9BILA|nr:hypothetical protein M513_08945 [Trichuris suis]KFD70403.1 hypothetical protein M514_08945 [Trichuris suis]